MFTFYDQPGAAALRGGAGAVRRRADRRQRRRHADQVPGRAARVLLPRRLVLPRARHPRPGRAHLRHPARRRVHQGRLQPASWAACSRTRASSWSPSSTPVEVDAPAAGSSPTTAARSASTWRSTVPLHGGAAYVGRSPGPRRRARLRSGRRAHPAGQGRPNIFVIGDAADVRASKAGSVAHFEGEILVAQHRQLPARPAAGRQLRRPHQLLHRKRLRQGAADRLQLRHRAGRRATSPAASACRCCRSPASTTSASSRSSGSTGTCSCRAATSPASALPCRWRESGSRQRWQPCRATGSEGGADHARHDLRRHRGRPSTTRASSLTRSNGREEMAPRDRRGDQASTS